MELTEMVWTVDTSWLLGCVSCTYIDLLVSVGDESASHGVGRLTGGDRLRYSDVEWYYFRTSLGFPVTGFNYGHWNPDELSRYTIWLNLDRLFPGRKSSKALNQKQEDKCYCNHFICWAGLDPTNVL